MKQKLGRKLLSFLLTLAMVVGLMPGMGLTAYAAGGVTIGNGSYPYGKNMEPSITFIVDVAASSGGEYQWYVSDSSDGDYSPVANTSGSFEANADSFETTFTPSNGKWYKCLINNEAQCETKPVMAKKENDRWYISNGTMAYSFFGNNTRFDVIGQIDGQWVTRTSYDSYWNFYTSTDATPAPLKVQGTGPSSSATLKSAKARFSTSNPHVVNFDATIGENEHAFAFGCDVKIRENDSAPTTAIIASRTGSVKQMQLVDTQNLATAADTDPAMVVKYTTIPTHFWIGKWTPRYYFATNDKTTSTYYEDGYCSWNDAGVCYQYQGGDSGMTVSWTNRNGGDTIGFSFALGSVAETGAVTGKIDYSGEQIESLRPNTTYVITVLDQNGNPTSETYTITSDSSGRIPLAGTDKNNKAYDLIGKLIQIGVENSMSDPLEMDIAPRPDAEDPSQSGGDDIYPKPEDVKENEVFVTENSITIKPQTDIGKRQQYRLYNSAGEEIAGQDWQSLGLDGTITFTGLSPNTSYLVKAFIPATQTAPKSLPSQGAKISTFGTITVTKPTPTELTYDKELHSFPITVDPSDATVSYSTAENVNYNSEVPSFTDAGEYTVYYRVLKENYTNVYGSFPVKINKATNPTTVSESTSVYSGGKTVDLSANVTRNGATGAVSYTISGEANGCTVDSNGILTSGSTAGSVTVKVTVAEDTNYQALPEKTITVTIIEKLTQTITASDVTATYGDTDKSVSGTTTGDGAISYSVKSGDAVTVDENTGALTILKAGSAVITVTAAETATYAQATKDVNVTVNTKAMTVSAENVNVTVDGQPHGITVNVTDPASGATVKYGTEEGSYTLDASPTQTEAGELTVYYQVTADNYTTYTGSAKVTVSDKSTQTIDASDVTATYGDTDKKVEATTDGNGAISYAVKEGSSDYIDVDSTTGALTIKKVGTATVIVTAAETATYAQATKEVTVTINNANAVAASVTANNRTYDGTEKPLVTVTGEPTGGEMQYALGTDATTAPTTGYTTSIPTATNAGTYYVWYYVKGDSNHTDSEPVCIMVKIAGAAYTVTDGEHTINDGKDTSVTVKREPDDSKTYDLYTGAQVDGKDLPEGSHTTAKGSLILTLKAAYLDTLTVGDHKLTIAFEDGSATATIKIKEAAPAPTATPKPVPKTGDGSNPALWLGLAVAGLILIAGTVILWNRKKRCGK